MKKVIILIVVIAAILLIPPFFIGSQVESEFRSQVEQLNTHPSYQVEIIEYKKGWFESQAVTKLTFNTAPELSAISDFLTFGMTQNMQHGPFLWEFDGPGFGLMDASLNFEIPAEWQVELDSLKSDSPDSINQDTLSFTSRTSFNLSTSGKVLLKPFAFNKEGVQIKVNAAEGLFSLTQAGHVQGELTWFGMSASEEGSDKLFQIGTIALTSNQQLITGNLFSPNALFSGKMLLKIAEVSANSTDLDDNFSTKNIELSAVSEYDNNLFDFHIVLTADSLQIATQEFSDIIQDLSIDNLDAEVLAEMNELITQNQAGSQQDPMQAMAEFQAFVPRLLAKDPILKINRLGMKTSRGDIDSNLAISINKTLYNVDNPMTLIIALQANAQGYVPEAFLLELGLANEVQQLVEQKMLIKDQQNLKFDFSFKDGQALVNGEPMALPL